MSINAEPIPTALEPRAPVHDALRNNPDGAQHTEAAAPSLTEALRLRRNLLQSLWVGVRQLPRGRRMVLLIRICVSLAQIIAFIPILSLPGSHRVSPSHEDGRVCNPDSLFKYLVVHMVRLALDIPVELYLGLSPHRTRQGRRAGPEARAIAERDRPLGSEYLDVKVGKISTLLGIASLVIFFVGNAIVYSSTECSRKPAETVPLFWSALASLIVVYIFIVEIAVLAFLIVCALPLLIVIMRALGLNHRLPQRELHPETGKIDQQEVDKRVKLVYYTPAEADDEDQPADQMSAQDASTSDVGADADANATSATQQSRAGMGSRQATQDSLASASHPMLGRLSRLTRLIVARRRSAPSVNEPIKSAASIPATATGTPAAEGRSAAPCGVPSGQRSGLKYPLHPLPAHRATCPICLCDFEEPEAGQEPEPEPLRLLACGHVMHRSCVDQWLTTVSGRCPVCQKAVIPDADEEAAPTAPANEAVEMQPLPATTH